MSLQGSFDPSVESRPAISYPSSINTLAQSSSETSLPAVTAYLFENPAGGSHVVDRSTIEGFTGTCSVRSRVTNAAFPPQSIPTETALRLTLPVASYPLGAFVRLRIKPTVSSLLVRARQENAIGGSGGDIGATTLCPVGVWTSVTAYFSALALSNNASFWGDGSSRCLVGFALHVGANSSREIFYDDLMVVNAASTSSPAWEPADGEPLYADGQSWVCTAPGTFQGLTLSTGDLVTAVTSLDYGTVDQVDWIQTDVVTGAAAALAQKPIGFVGYELGLGDWRIALQILLPEDSSSRWGIARWGDTIWSGLAWFDLSEWLRGASWKRGATSVGSRPEVGTCEITLSNLELQFSPWNGISAFQNATIVDPAGVVQPGAFGPGTLMRLVAYSPSGMINPLSGPEDLFPDDPDSWVGVFTGLVSTWDDATVELGSDRYVTINLVEILSSLAQVDEPALSSPVGNDDLPAIRLQRLLDAAGWKYGDVVDLFDFQLPSTEYELQSTVMASNRLGELYLTADSVDGVVRSGRDGSVVLYNNYPQQSWIPSGAGVRQGPDHSRFSRVGPAFSESEFDVTFVVPYVGDSITTANDDEVIQNQLSFGFAGGSVRQLSDSISLQLYDPVSAGRTDLICSSTQLVDAIMERTLDVRARLALRLSGMSLHSRHPGALSALLSVDVDDVLDVELPPLLDGYTAVVSAADVLGMSHYLIPLPAGGVVWTADYALGLQGALTLEETP